MSASLNQYRLRRQLNSEMFGEPNVNQERFLFRVIAAKFVMKLKATFLFTLIGIAACAGNDKVVTESYQLPLPDSTTVEPARNALIQPGDQVEVRVFGIEDLSGTFDVDQSGAVKVPLIGAINARGLTAIQFAATVEDALEESYVRDADVSVLIEAGSVRAITVEGAVNLPGVYEIDGPTTLLRAIAFGGGTDDNANTKRVIVFREIDGERQAAGFDLSKIRLGEAEDPMIFGNDVVVVDNSVARSTYGEIIQSIPLLGVFVRAEAGVRYGR